MKRLITRYLLPTLAALAPVAATAEPDLQIHSVQYETQSYAAGDTVEFSIVLFNDGTPGDLADVVNVPFDVEIVVGFGSPKTAKYKVSPPMLAGLEGKREIKVPFQIPADWPSGIYPVTVYVDPPNLGNVWEAEGEGNNTYSGLPLRVDYNPQNPPQVNWIFPAPGLGTDDCAESATTLVPGQAVVLEVSATDIDGRVASVEFFAEGLRLASPDLVAPFQANWIPPAPGIYELHAIATDNDGLRTYKCISVRAEYPADLEPPQVSIFSPRPGTSYLPSTTLTLFANAHASEGLISSVAFYVNNALVGTANQAPFAINWVVPSSGNYSVKAVATDTTGNTATSESVAFRGAAPGPNDPVVRITHPLPLGGGDTVNDVSVGSRMMINAEVDAVDPVSEVRFYINGTLVGTSNAGLDNFYGILYRTNATGNYVISAEAVDTAGRIGQAEAILLNVVPLEAPVAANELTVFPATISVGEWALLSSSTDSGLLHVDRVDFFANNVLIGSQERDEEEERIQTFELLWYPNTPGTYEIRTRAVQIDAGGAPADNWIISNPMTITVNASDGESAFAVDFTSPSNGDTVSVNQPVEITASAFNPGGSVSRVEFYLNGQLIGEPDTTYPYSVEFTPASVGDYRFAVRAFSDKGTSVWGDNLLILTANTGPAITQFSSDAVRSRAMEGAPITFSIEAVDESGIDEVALLRDGVVIATLYDAPYVFEDTSTEPGDYEYQVRVTDSDGNQSFSKVSVINVQKPDPLNSDRDFVYQTFQDLLFRAPSPEELTLYQGMLRSGAQRSAIVVDILAADKVAARRADPNNVDEVRQALVSWYLLENSSSQDVWPARDQLKSDVMLVRGSGLLALVNQQLPVFQTDVFKKSLPHGSSSPNLIREYVSQLWNAKYSAQIKSEQANWSVELVQTLDTPLFTERFVRDYGIVNIGFGENVTPVLGYLNVPNDRVVGLADAASLLINMQREQPTKLQVSNLAGVNLPQDRAKQVLESDAYQSRFKTMFREAEVTAKHWRFQPWFGHFSVVAEDEGWLYHTEHGWMYTGSNGQTEDDFWAWDMELGWIYTGTGFYPYLWSSDLNSWLYYYTAPADGKPQWFYHFGTGAHFSVERY